MVRVRVSKCGFFLQRLWLVSVRVNSSIRENKFIVLS